MKKSQSKPRRKPAKTGGRTRGPRAAASAKLDRMLFRAAQLIDDGRSGDALALLDTLTAKHPQCADAWALKGRAHGNFLDQMTLACEALETACDLQPDNVARLMELGTARRNAGQHLLACKAFMQAYVKQPDNQRAIASLALMYNQLGDAASAVELYRPLIERNGDIYGNYLLIQNYVDHLDAETLAQSAFRWGRYVETKVSPLPEVHPTPAAGRRLRIAYISADLRSHSVMRFLTPLLEHHDRSRYDIVCYYNGRAEREDEITQHVRENCTSFVRVQHLDDRELAQRIRDDRIDIVIELAGHTSGNRLNALALKPAPVQVSWLGYPNTTGLSTIDYRISDPVVDPAGMFDHLSSERIVRMDGGFHCFRSIDGTPEVAPLPALTRGHITFGAYNNLSKVTPTTLDLWSGVLKSVPGSRLTIKSNALIDPNVAERLRGEFQDRGIGPDRLNFSGWLNDQQAHLASYGDIDIALDAYPYNGTTTTCEALWMGVPTITLCGSTPASRVSASLLTQVGLEPLIAYDAETFGLNAAELASDIDRLAALRAQLRTAMNGSTLRDEPGFARRFEALLSELFERKAAEAPNGARTPTSLGAAADAVPAETAS